MWGFESSAPSLNKVQSVNLSAAPSVFLARKYDASQERPAATAKPPLRGWVVLCAWAQLRNSASLPAEAGFFHGKGGAIT